MAGKVLKYLICKKGITFMLLDFGPLLVIHVNLPISNAFTMEPVMKQGARTSSLTLMFVKSTLAHHNINLIDFQSIVTSLGSSGCFYL